MNSHIKSRIDSHRQSDRSTSQLKPIGIWEWDLSSNSVHCSPEWKRFRGCSAKEVWRAAGQVRQFIHPSDRLNREKIHARLRAGELELIESEYRVEKSDGSWATVLGRTHSICNDQGQPIRLVGCEFEVSIPQQEHLSGIEELRELNTRLHKLLEASSIGIWEWFFEDERLVWDEKMHEIYGIEAQDFHGTYKDWSDRIHPDDLEQVISEDQSRKEKSQQIAQEFRIVRPSGKVRHIHANAYKELDKNGKLVRAIGVNLDITKRREAEFALVESESHLQRIADHLPGMVFRYYLKPDGTSGWSYLSSQSRELFGIESSDLMADKELLWQRIESGDLERMTTKMFESANELTRFVAEFRTTTPDHDARWFLINSQPQRSENGDVVWDGVILEVTDRKEVELANDVLAKATKTKDEFLANMSHELRTPLTAILAMTDGMQQGVFGDTSSRQLDCLKIVEQSSMHLLDLINEVLDLAKIESGKSELDLTAIQVSKLCESCLSLVTPQAEQKQIELSLEASCDLPRLDADAKRFRQVLINLLSNAVKFTPERGKVKLAVETLPASTSGFTSEALRFSVSDTGIGIKDDQLDAMFDPFVQVDSSLTRRHGGTGLGLSLVKRLVELHGGKVGVTSKVNLGSCFTVDLPIGSKRLELATKPNANLPTRASKGSELAVQISDGNGSPLILLAEDNDMVAQTMIPLLEFCNFRVLRAANGKLAVEMAREHLPDLILMDIQMPEMDGLEAARKIRGIAEIADLPIIAVSGFASPADSKRAIDAGMNSFMAKPVRIQELAANINSTLSKNAKMIDR